MKNVKPRNTLRHQKGVSKLLREIVDKTKEEFELIDFEKIRHDPNTILYLMEAVEAGLKDETIIDKKTAKRLERNELVLEVVKLLFPNITKEEVVEVTQIITFIADSKIIRKPNFFCEW